MGWVHLFRRRLRVFNVAFVIYRNYKAVNEKARRLAKSDKDALMQKAHEENGRRMLNLMIELEGLWVKLGQYFSTRPDLLPGPYVALFKQLQDSVPPRPAKEVRRTIKKQLKRSVRDIFSIFINAPIGAASIGQVHRATLKDGQEVVVKVQHEGIKEVILEDLKTAKSLVNWIAWAEPQLDFGSWIDEWCKEVPKELDFNHEAENTRKVFENLGCRREHKRTDHLNSLDVLVPEVIESSEKVLILQYMDGIRLNDIELLDAYGVDKQKLVEEITRAYAHQIFVDGLFSGDPHPGNFLVSKDPPHCPILLDFGLTKSISSSMRQALAKMFLACAERNHVALLSSFEEMGLKLCCDMPEQVLDITAVLFRTSNPAAEAQEKEKSSAVQGEKDKKAIQEEANPNEKAVQREKKKKKVQEKACQHKKGVSSKKKERGKKVQVYNPIVAFPGDAVIFVRVISLLRAISSSLNVSVVYLDIMRPFAESALLGNLRPGPTMNTLWIYESPVHNDVETKLRQLLIEIGNKKILGIQVCAYKDGKVIIDTAAGVRGRYDPKPVQPDTLFPVFSVTKGITAGMVHWLVDKGKLNLEETIAKIWPDFETNGKQLIKVHHVLNHTSGLEDAVDDLIRSDPLSLCDWEKSLKHIANSSPATEPGSKQHYHYLSFGWLCGGVIEYASGKKFQDLLEEAIVHPLNLSGEIYIGIPAGVESRLATLTIDATELEKFSESDSAESPKLGSTEQLVNFLPELFNTLHVRRAIIPAANGHVTARALARYYAALATGGIIPPPHSDISKPLLGSHTHIPKLPTLKDEKKRGCLDFFKGKSSAWNLDGEPDGSKPKADHAENADGNTVERIFNSPKILEAFLGAGDHSNLVLPNGEFGLGFRQFKSANEKTTSFGHSGMGGSTGFCNVVHNFSIAVTVNKMSMGDVTRRVVQLVCSELNVPLPEEFSETGHKGPDMQLL